VGDYQFVRYQTDGRIARITINRPEVMNALHPPASQELEKAFQEFCDDPELWVAILTGEGDRAFSAGSDLKWRAAEADEEALRNPGTRQERVMQRCVKPIIAAVNGYAVGGGMELALHCDIIVASETARFGLPEVRRSLLADTGGVLKLPQRIPYHLAMGMILTGRLVPAEEAAGMGLVNQVVPADELMETAERWAGEILECGPLAVRAAKDVIKRTIALPPEVAMGLLEGLESVRTLRESQDYQEGPKAFAEKRKPNWQAR
jgi:crotonobetainyl-CoA hydratase